MNHTWFYIVAVGEFGRVCIAAHHANSLLTVGSWLIVIG